MLASIEKGPKSCENCKKNKNVDGKHYKKQISNVINAVKFYVTISFIFDIIIFI